MLTTFAFARIPEVRVVDGAPTFAFVQAKFTVEVSVAATVQKAYTDVPTLLHMIRPADAHEVTLVCAWVAAGKPPYAAAAAGRAASSAAPFSTAMQHAAVTPDVTNQQPLCARCRRRRRSGLASIRSPRSCPPAKPAAQTSVRLSDCHPPNS